MMIVPYIHKPKIVRPINSKDLSENIWSKSISIIVKYTDGTLVEEATVALINGANEVLSQAHTGKDGVFIYKYSGPDLSHAILRIRKFGYLPIQINFNLTHDYATIVVLVKDNLIAG